MTTKHIPYFTFYPSDFMNGVRGMTPQEVGVYTMLLCRIYEENGPVEVNILRLSTYCGMREKTFGQVFQRLVDLGKFHLIDGCLMNSRAEIEIRKRSNDLKFASEAGKASAKKRQQNQRTKATTVQRPFNHTDTDTDTIKDTPNGVSKKTASRLSPDWHPTQEQISFALGQGFDAAAIRAEADKFRDYWISKSGRDAAKQDWPATWRNWIRNSTGRRGQEPQKHKTAFQQHQDEAKREANKALGISDDDYSNFKSNNIIDLAAADYRSR